MARDTRDRRFQFRECLGAGAFGDVYRATMTSPGGLKAEVAVKILRDPSPDAIKRLRDEGKLLALLRHPAILRAFDLAGVDGKVALVTEYVDGADLSRLVEPGAGRLPVRAVVEAIGTVADALHVAFATVPVDHDAPLRLVHRDIKPSNVRVSRHGEVRLLDFGIAWSGDAGREAKTNANATVGSLAYMAPERFSRAQLRSASDVYALGCTLFEGITGARLIEDAVPTEMFQRAAFREAHDDFVRDRLATLPPDLPAPLRDLLGRMLRFDADDRPDTAEVAAACDRLADELPGLRLKAWCRDRDWPANEGTRGAFTGATVSEESIAVSTADVPTRDTQSTLDMSLGTLETPLQESPGGATFELHTAEPSASGPVPIPGPGPGPALTPAPAPALTPAPAPALTPAPPARVPVAWVAIGGAAAIGAVVILALVAWGPSASTADAVTTAVEVPVDPAVVAPIAVVRPETPVVPPPPATAPAISPTPPPPSVKPPPKPQVAPSKPEVTPPKVTAPVETARAVEPPPPAKAPGTVRLVGEATVELRGAATHPPGDVPAGTYEIWADFGTGYRAQGAVTVASGAVATVRCNKIKYKCEVEY